MGQGLVQDCQFVEMGGEECKASDLGCYMSAGKRQRTVRARERTSEDVLADSPCETETIIRRSTPSKLINDDKRVFRSRLIVSFLSSRYIATLS